MDTHPDTPRLLLVSTPHSFGWPWGKGNAYRGFYEYLGTGYLAAACQASGIAVDILDAPFHGWGPKRTVEEIRKRQFDVLGLSCNWQEFFPQCAAVLNALGDIGKPLVLGGHFPTVAHHRLFQDFPQLNAICLGEGEATLVEMMGVLAHDNNVDALHDVPGLSLASAPGTNPLRPMCLDLDSLPFPLRPQARMYRRDKNPGVAAANILSTRGCGGACTFCTIHAFQAVNPGPKWRTRSPENTVDEIEKLQKDYGFRNFRFVDEDFFGRCEEGQARARDLATEIQKRGLKLNFELYCRPDEVVPETLHILQGAGLDSIYLSLDAVTESDIALYGKDATRERMVESLRYVAGSGMRFGYSFIFWHPYRKLGELKDAFSIIDSAAGGDPKVYSHILSGMQTGIISDLVVLTGSPLEERIRRDGLLKGDYREYSYDFVDPKAGLAYRAVRAYKGVKNTVNNAKNMRYRPKKDR